MVNPVQSIDWPAAAIVIAAMATVSLTFLKLYTGSANVKLQQIIEELKRMNKALYDDEHGLKPRLERVQIRQEECLKRQEG